MSGRFEKLTSFLLDDTGAVTVNWVVMSAAAVGMAVPATVVVRNGAGDLASSIQAALSDASVAAIGIVNQVGLMGFDDGNFTGWSLDRVGESEALGVFLGPFAGREDPLTYDITMPEGASNLEITFDLLLLDSWDGVHERYSDVGSGGRGDGVAFTIDGVEIGFSAMRNNWSQNPSGSFELNGTTYTYEMTHAQSDPLYTHPSRTTSWTDAVWSVTVTAENVTASEVEFGVNGTSNQGVNDESFGIDNFVVSPAAS